MVFYYISCEPYKYMIYMGRDKEENEYLISYGFPEDIWFHVDNLSSAHVYLRLPEGQGIDDIPQDVLIDCAQLVKQNSIQGCKQNNIQVVYTPWSNLKKTQSMETGQVGFKNNDSSVVRKVRVEKKINAIINRLEKTKREENPDFKALQEARLSQIRQADKKKKQVQKDEEKQKIEAKKKEQETLHYVDFMKADTAVSNSNMSSTFEDDFM
eukprot:TRINITY_DN4613_c0_g2_i1.p1 TRINITY_DN4613_c0_g2~~TRINITY_DN4613_c0_g2_i1.p1  ORF type:complete len:211 (+),score=51.06 TRINITY_DN4613_c0_g2_i1:30-662(+)